MKVVVNENSAIERTLEVQVESARVQQAWDKHMNDVLRNVAIPGFRKGKAPKKIAERYANRDHLRRTVFEDVGVTAYEQALREQKLDPVGQPSLEMVQFEEGKDLIFKATFEVRPVVEVAPSEYDGLEVEVAKADVTDADVQIVLEDFQKKAERTVPVEEERGLVKGDVAVVDFASKIGDEPVPNGASDNFQMDVNDDLFIAGFADKLIGLKVDEKRSFDFDFPEEYGNKTLAGQTVTFDFDLKSIKKRELPEIDDELARQVSRFETLDELKTSIRERMEKNIRHELGNRALEKLAEDKQVLIPRAFLHQMLNFIVQSQARQLSQMGMKLEDFLKARNMTFEQHVSDLHPQAEKMAKAEPISDAIIRNEGFTASEEELDEEIRKFSEQSSQEFAAVKAAIIERNEMDGFTKDLLRRKVMELLSAKAKPVTRKELPSAEAAPEGEAEAAPAKTKKAAKAEKSEEAPAEAAADEEKPAKKPRAKKAKEGEEEE